MEEENAPSQPRMTEEQITEDLRTNPRYQSYFKGFQPGSVDDFIKDYAWRKKMWLDYGQSALDRKARAETHWIEAAALHLSYIQQKKLFDVQCRWRAEQATFPDILICADFRTWEKDVLNCPFLEPITPDEVECYQQFLQSNNANLEEMPYVRWQAYTDFKEAYQTDNADEPFPEWYEFHNNRTGAGVYLTLPDIRGEKEGMYLDLYYGRQEATRTAQEKTAPARDTRPRLAYYDTDHLRFFITTFEDAHTRELYEAYTYSNRHREEERSLEVIISFLLNTDEVIPIERHADFREALREAAHRYELQKIADHLPIAYQEYCLNQSLGLRSPIDEKDQLAKGAEGWRDRILEGRKLAGEPEDFDF